METENKQINLELKSETAKGCYSNLAIITHSHSEFVLDFATVLPGMPKPEIGSRIVMAPEHVKRLFLALRDNIGKYESNFGPIDLPERPGSNTFNLADLNPNGTKS